MYSSGTIPMDYRYVGVVFSTYEKKLLKMYFLGSKSNKSSITFLFRKFALVIKCINGSHRRQNMLWNKFRDKHFLQKDGASLNFGERSCHPS